MKQIISNLIMGKDSKVSGAIAIGIISLIVLGCTCGKNLDLGNISSESNSSRTASNDSTTSDTKADGSLPSESVIQALVRETTTDFARAIDTGDFSSIYEKSSSDFQSTYTEDQMKDAFKTFTNQKSRVVPILERASGMTSEFSPAPYVRTEKGLSILVINGKYPTKPIPVRTEYEYVFRGGEWKMLKLIVKITN
ncbi:MAG: hypothetical protein JNK51_13120 [Blastocatellia bacterium]|nr:hypothetical protein [Chloracidobacterium sp.]MBL8185855.1 hypothetical protein [Blastocatellia bacterium]HBE83783.1 hypothetical protein [Blastocatellia bacterium]HRJ87077.1 hypothetical protein [Pyrinomonadaceae bacterium]HRK51518.1 hypothetical protein [Pyrinomonadaceae bacterium]